MIHCNNLYASPWQGRLDSSKMAQAEGQDIDPFSQEDEADRKARERKEAKRQARREWRKTQPPPRQRDGGGRATTVKNCKILEDDEEERDSREEEKGGALILLDTNEQDPLVVDDIEVQHENPSGDDNQCELSGERSNEVSNKPTYLIPSSWRPDKAPSFHSTSCLVILPAFRAGCCCLD